jgi:hypothetical protein
MFDRIVRSALAVSVPFNLTGAYVFGFPGSQLGRLEGLSPATPALYRALVALFLVLFAGAYGWLAAHREISRPLLALGAIGKAVAFLTFAALALEGLCPPRLAFGGIGDAVLASIFAGWLLASAKSAARRDQGPE